MLIVLCDPFHLASHAYFQYYSSLMLLYVMTTGRVLLALSIIFIFVIHETTYYFIISGMPVKWGYNSKLSATTYIAIELRVGNSIFLKGSGLLLYLERIICLANIIIIKKL